MSQVQCVRGAGVCGKKQCCMVGGEGEKNQRRTPINGHRINNHLSSRACGPCPIDYVASLSVHACCLSWQVTAERRSLNNHPGIWFHACGKGEEKEVWEGAKKFKPGARAARPSRQPSQNQTTEE